MGITGFVISLTLGYLIFLILTFVIRLVVLRLFKGINNNQSILLSLFPLALSIIGRLVGGDMQFVYLAQYILEGALIFYTIKFLISKKYIH